MTQLGLRDFDRDIRIDSASLREEIQCVRMARGAGRGKPIADDSWTEWRNLAKATPGAKSLSQREAVLVTWMAFYPFSGKKCNGGIPFNRIQRGHYQRLTEEWLKAIDDRSVRRVIKYIQSVSLTPDEMIELVAEGAKHCEKKPRFSKRTFQRWASMSKEPLKADRPLSQKFVRSVLRRTVLRPVKAG